MTLPAGGAGRLGWSERRSSVLRSRRTPTSGRPLNSAPGAPRARRSAHGVSKARAMPITSGPGTAGFSSVDRGFRGLRVSDRIRLDRERPRHNAPFGGRNPHSRCRHARRSIDRPCRDAVLRRSNGAARDLIQSSNSWPNSGISTRVPSRHFAKLCMDFGSPYTRNVVAVVELECHASSSA